MTHPFLRNSTVFERMQELLRPRGGDHGPTGGPKGGSNFDHLWEVVPSTVAGVLVFIVLVVVLFRRYLAKVKELLRGIGLIAPQPGNETAAPATGGGGDHACGACAGPSRNLTDNEILMMREIATRAARAAESRIYENL